jgi:hypothetical protein
MLDEVVDALPPESEEELARKRREVESDEFSREMESGRLEPIVVGEGDADDATDGDGDGAAIEDEAAGSGTR